MTIVLLGKAGQLGVSLQRSLAVFGKIIALGRDEIDLMSSGLIQQLLTQYAPQVIINAAAYTAVDLAQTHREQAYQVNAEALKTIARFCVERQSLLVHYSTDYVFDGNKLAPYVETDKAAPLNVYGESKLAGEQAIQTSGCHYLLFRTSWVYSAHGNNFINTILKLAKERTQLRIVGDQLGAPTSAELIADVTAHALIAWRQQRLGTGIYHLSALGVTNWHELACLTLQLAQHYGETFSCALNQIYKINSDAYPTPAQRPKNSCLDCTYLQNALGIQLPDWQYHFKLMMKQRYTMNR